VANETVVVGGVLLFKVKENFPVKEILGLKNSRSNGNIHKILESTAVAPWKMRAFDAGISFI
jgi:hypothetical protein